MIFCTCVLAYLGMKVSQPLQCHQQQKIKDADAAAAFGLPMLPLFFKPIHIALNALIIAEPFGG